MKIVLRQLARLLARLERPSRRDQKRREAALAEPFPRHWAELLDARSAHYRRLPGELRERFARQTQIFLSTQRLTGVEMEVTVETKLLVAASAVSLSVGWAEYSWEQLAEVLLYPADFDRDYSFGGTYASGQAHPWGIVIISVPALNRSFAESTHGYHVGYHEFAHLLDLAQSQFDGTPSYLSDDAIRHWVEIVEDERERLVRDDSILDAYALSTPVEFFAVAVEAFLQTPVALADRHGELYRFLSSYFCQDPAAWQRSLDGAPFGSGTGEAATPASDVRARFHMHSRKQLTAELHALGIVPGDVVMVHASVRAVGEIAGGPDEIHLALKDALTDEGTLMMYAGCPRYADEVGRGNLSASEEAEILEKLPAFDPDTARSARDHGILVEFMRTYPGSRVNRHVARFVAWGKQADVLFSHQPWDYAFGHGSALDRFVGLNGKILLLGCDHDTVTFLHYVEHIADIPDKRVARFKVPVLENGNRIWRDMAEFDTSGGVHANWPERFFAKLVDTHLAATANGGGLVGDASCHLLSARELLAFARPVMERVAADPRAADDLAELHAGIS